MRLPVVLAALCLPATLAAQDPVFRIGPTASCLADQDGAEPRRGCIGRAAAACMESSAAGSTTVGMGYCLEQELDWWDGRLNAAYGALRDRTRASDADMAELGSAAAPLTPRLRDMQRAWIAFRDRTCDFEMAQWGGGTGQGPALIGCLMQQTAAQTIYLETVWIGQ